ncbi:MAG: hypothetical protein ACFE8P_12695 [Promethearchaeota archaeon]
MANELVQVVKELVKDRKILQGKLGKNGTGKGRMKQGGIIIVLNPYLEVGRKRPVLVRTGKGSNGVPELDATRIDEVVNG